MTENTLFKKLSRILETVDRERYFETVSTIACHISEDGEVYLDAFTFAEMLQDSDKAETMPQEVAELLKEIYLEETEQGNAAAMTNLGSLYYTGRGGEQSYEKAVFYYTMADRHGERQATENLGYCYYYGRVGEPDYKKAFHYFIKGALDNHLNSLYKIGDMYRNGYYVEKDENQAFYIYRHCYEQMTEQCRELIGADICMRMGDAYYEGIGTEKDYEAALHFYQEAEQWFYFKLRQGDFFAQKGLEHTIERQSAVRKALMKSLPSFDWRE